MTNNLDLSLDKDWLCTLKKSEASLQAQQEELRHAESLRLDVPRPVAHRAVGEGVHPSAQGLGELRWVGHK